MVTSSCAALSDVPSEDLAYLGASDAVNGTYATGAVTVFKCDGSAGFGYVTYTCQDDHMWGSPSRECDGALLCFLPALPGFKLYLQLFAA